MRFRLRENPLFSDCPIRNRPARESCWLWQFCWRPKSHLSWWWSASQKRSFPKSFRPPSIFSGNKMLDQFLWEEGGGALVIIESLQNIFPQIGKLSTAVIFPKDRVQILLSYRASILSLRGWGQKNLVWFVVVVVSSSFESAHSLPSLRAKTSLVQRWGGINFRQNSFSSSSFLFVAL